MMMSSPLDDLTSKIPEEIVIGEILSRLSIKEAGRTSILSHKWKNLWKFIGGCLDFNDPETILLLNHCQKRFDIEERKYVNWINQVLDLHQAPRIEKFRVCFDLGKDRASTIDKWIAFAAARRVRRLELDLSPIHAAGRLLLVNKLQNEIYKFPTSDQLLKLLGSHWGGYFKELISLRLDGVDVAQEHVLDLLSNCPLLEEISIADAPSLHRLRIVVSGAGQGGLTTAAADHHGHQSNSDDHQPLKLKHLEIRQCLGLEHLEVSAAARNLVSFKYQGRLHDRYFLHVLTTTLRFQHVPKLSWVSLGHDAYCENLVARGFRGPLPFPTAQLQRLTLDLHDMISHASITFPPELAVQFTDLRQLELVFKVLDEQSMLFVGSFLRASPVLHTLVLKYHLDWIRIERVKAEPWFRKYDIEEFGETHRQLVKNGWRRYECLEEVEFWGWNGLETDVELVTHLIITARSLKRITVDPCNPFYVGRWKRLTVPAEVIAAEEYARERARDLQAILSSTTKLVIL